MIGHKQRGDSRSAIALLLILLLSVPAVVASATEGSSDSPDSESSGVPDDSEYATPGARLLRSTLENASDVPLTEMTSGELIAVLELASVARQETAHVHLSGLQSMAVPGWGQFTNGERGRAAVWFLADLFTGLTTLSLAYVLLPPAVQWRNLNYLQTPLATIRERFGELTVADLIPFSSVMFAGTMLSLGIRHFAAQDAAQVAVKAIEDGHVHFEPGAIMLHQPILPGDVND
jgi:hypothetical protein